MGDTKVLRIQRMYNKYNKEYRDMTMIYVNNYSNMNDNDKITLVNKLADLKNKICALSPDGGRKWNA